MGKKRETMTPSDVLRSRGVDPGEWKDLLMAMAQKRYGKQGRSPGAFIYNEFRSAGLGGSFPASHGMLAAAGLPQNDEGWRAFVLESTGLHTISKKEALSGKKNRGSYEKIAREDLPKGSDRLVRSLAERMDERDERLFKGATLRAGGYASAGAFFGKYRRTEQVEKRIGPKRIRVTRVYIEIM